MDVQEVVVKHTQPMRIAEATGTAAGFGNENLAPVFAELLPAVLEELGRAGVRPGMSVAHYEEFADDAPFVVHAGFEIGNQSFAANEKVDVVELPSERVASVVHPRHQSTDAADPEPHLVAHERLVGTRERGGDRPGVVDRHPHRRRSTSAVCSSAGRNASRCSSVSVTSVAVANDVIVVISRRSPSTEPFSTSGPGTAAAVQMANQMGMVFSKLDCKPRWRERLAEIDIPTLVVDGRRDPFFPVGDGEAIAREIPGARLMVLEEAATAIPDAAAADVAEAMLALG